MKYLGAISSMTGWMILVSFPRQAIQHHSNPSLCPYHWCQRSWSWQVLWRPRRPPRTNTKEKDDLFIIGDWNAKVGSQEIPGITGKFGLGEQNEAGQRLNWILPKECTRHSKHPFFISMRDKFTHGHHQGVKTEMKLIIFFVAQDEVAVCNQQNEAWS